MRMSWGRRTLCQVPGPVRSEVRVSPEGYGGRPVLCRSMPVPYTPMLESQLVTTWKHRRFPLIPVLLCLFGGYLPALLYGGVSREIENEYRGRYENRAIFLKVPVHGRREILYPRGGGVVPDAAVSAEPLAFRVGDQVRITKLNFRDSNIEFEIASVDLNQKSAILFDFGQSLTYTFSRRDEFEAALAATFTEGLTYRQIDQAREDFVKDQFSRVVSQIATTTGAETDFVIETILSASPEFAAVQRRAAQLEEQLQGLQGQLREKESAQSAADTEVRNLRNRLSDIERSRGDLEERARTVEAERDRLNQELQQLRTTSRRYEEQLREVASRLDVEAGSRDQLGRQVESLSQNIDNLKRERDSFEEKSNRLEKQVTDLQSERSKLTDELSSARRELASLRSDLRTLTSNRESLQATFVRTREARDQLETANQLADALTLRRRTGTNRDSAKSVMAEVYLLTQRLGQIEVIPPERAEDPGRLRVELNSPDTVQFNEEERRLLEALGKHLTVEAEWTSWSGDLKAALVEGEPSQTVEPRESASWVWNFQGAVARPEPLSLELRLTDAHGLPVRLGEFQFEVQPGGISGILGGISLLWLGVGVVLGSLLGGGLIGLTRSRTRRTAPPRQTRSYSSEKSL